MPLPVPLYLCVASLLATVTVKVIVLPVYKCCIGLFIVGVIFVPSIAAEGDISPFTILPSTIIADVTVLLLGVPILTVDPKTTTCASLPLAGAAANFIVLPSKAKPSDGVEVPALGFCITPLILRSICCAFAGAFVTVKF